MFRTEKCKCPIIGIFQPSSSASMHVWVSLPTKRQSMKESRHWFLFKANIWASLPTKRQSMKDSRHWLLCSKPTTPNAAVAQQCKMGRMLKWGGALCSRYTETVNHSSVVCNQGSDLPNFQQSDAGTWRNLTRLQILRAVYKVHRVSSPARL